MSTAFRLKTFPEILSNMFARGRALLDDDLDLNPGSVVRTVMEASALQDADQYVQISRLLDMFSLDTVQGDDLDRRAIDFGADVFPDLRRRAANTSISKIAVGDGTLLAQNYLASDATIDAASFTLTDGSTFPTSGTVVLERGTQRAEEVIYTRSGNVFSVVYPLTGLVSGHAIGTQVLRVATQSLTTASLGAGATILVLTSGSGSAWPASGNVILERDTVLEETLAFTRVADTLTIAPTTFAHTAGIQVTLSTFGSLRTITAGVICYVPATLSTKQINFSVVTGGTLLDGDLTSELIDVVSTDVGTQTRVGGGNITRWSAPPFTNATVTNPVASTRGADRELDDPYRQRIRDFIQSLSRGTPLSITTLVNGLQDPDTNAAVAFAQIVEPVLPGLSYLYITDGTSSFSLDQNPFLGRDVLIRDAETGDRRGRLGAYGPFAYSPSIPHTPRLFSSVERGVATSVGVGTMTDSSQAMGVNAFVNMYLKSDDDQFYLILSNSSVAFTLSTGGAVPSLGSYSVYDFGGSPLIPGTDFTFNPATGDVELTTALVAHDGLVAAADGADPSVGAYTYTSGLGAYVQRKVNGDPTDFQTFPGIRASGSQVRVIAPTVISQTFTIQVVPARGFTDADVADAVRTAVQTYLNSLGIGENVILSEIVAAIQAIPNITDVVMVNPTANVTVPDGQLMRITDVNVIVV